ncbi:alpha/beta fold hydrolase [Halomonas urumqiensis]|uniref:Alpha/beta hydrolase n=1 Tax=Halomonas urumqiensis TaxID=1684789 RepID=A0A2N7UHJ9_9GAMM|nr:alpha/beta hydrolase [Halomonas urumqiensis]PMR79927.1 alpha/beta hydrolase [Halomonas urumqiensis]PTB02048.1 alpha/beta hydrolase [Halomonas urumqiensis]GHE21487.1 hydrolase [Halomonas urumqiensis]
MSDPRPLRLAGGRLAALSVGDDHAPTWLALHGWLDNAASFSRLAPLLAERLGIRLVAIDFAGHGLSAPLPGGGDYAIWDYCHDVLDALESLELEQVTLLSHSMGAGVACLTAAAFPEHASRLVLIDGIGTLTTPAGDAHTQLRKGLKGHRRPVSPAPRYADIDSAVAARVAGGATPIDADTARPLVARNLLALADGHQQLRTDGRLLRPSLVRLCPEQVRAMLERIDCPVLLVEGEQGILAEREHAAAARAAILSLTRRVIPGGHHLHLEAGAVNAVAEAIVAWQRS